MAAMVTLNGTPSPTPSFVDNARPSEDDGRLGCDDGRPVDVMVRVADEEGWEWIKRQSQWRLRLKSSML